MTDVLAGRVPLMFGPAATVWSNVQGGKSRLWRDAASGRQSAGPTCSTPASIMVGRGRDGRPLGLRHRQSLELAACTFDHTVAAGRTSGAPGRQHIGMLCALPG